jgi:hypothetical protein
VHISVGDRTVPLPESKPRSSLIDGMSNTPGPVIGPRDISHLASDTPQIVDMRTYVASGPHQLFPASAEGRLCRRSSLQKVVSGCSVVVVVACKQQRIINNSDICLICTVKFPQLIATIPPNHHLPCNKMVGSDSRTLHTSL